MELATQTAQVRDTTTTTTTTTTTPTRPITEIDQECLKLMIDLGDRTFKIRFITEEIKIIEDRLLANNAELAKEHPKPEEERAELRKSIQAVT